MSIISHMWIDLAEIYKLDRPSDRMQENSTPTDSSVRSLIHLPQSPVQYAIKPDMFEFNVADSFIHGLRYQGRTFTGAWEQLWLDGLPAANNDSYRYQWELNPGLLGQVRHLNH